MHRNVEACEWLTGAIVRLDSPNLDSTYSNMRAVCSQFLTLSLSFNIFLLCNWLNLVTNAEKTKGNIDLHASY